MILERDERGVSIAVTHVLTVGITAILISGLLIAGSSLLETEQERSTESALETIGERLASEIAAVDQTTEPSDTVRVNTSHPRTVSGSGYRVALADGSTCTGYPLVDTEPCVILEADGEDVTVAVPLAVDSGVDTSVEVRGGTIEITRRASGDLTLEDYP
ncbi:DUF7266 family protein [Halovivax cerinus]|uniref:Archaeal flagellin-like protein n=1 Tax=Halovivax cerinus TaxID=1487865 RepID=A0ABD5NKN1_9EURY|nr:hypothetical protein [Halovivax cerinus]